MDEPTAIAAANTMKFGWAASSGGLNDNHAVASVTASSVNDVQPSLNVTSPASVPAQPSGGTVTVPFTVSTAAVDGPEAQPVQATITMPPAASFAATPPGTGWVCPDPTGSTLTCTLTPADAINLGSDLPPLGTIVASNGSGTFTVTTAVTSVDNRQTPPAQASTQVTFAPVASAAAAAGTAADTPTPITAQPQPPRGTGPFTYAIAATPTQGTASIDAATGQLSFTPPVRSSGITTFTYTVTDASGVTSVPAPITVTVTPRAATVPGASRGLKGAAQRFIPPRPTGNRTICVRAGRKPGPRRRYDEHRP